MEAEYLFSDSFLNIRLCGVSIPLNLGCSGQCVGL